LCLNVSSVRITYGKNYYSTGHEYMILLRWRMRAFEGEVIGKELKEKEKINIVVPPLAEKSFVSSHGLGNPGF
jgi:hypothetical protein